METKSKKKLFNIIMAGVIALVALGGILAVGNVKGWFDNDEEAIAKADDITGVVSIERAGVAFNLEKKMNLHPGDVIRTSDKAEVTVKWGQNTFELAPNTALKLNPLEEEKLSAELEAGEIFVTLKQGDIFGMLIAQQNEITAQGTVFSVNVQTGSMGINVYEGTVNVNGSQGSATASAGEAISIVGTDYYVLELEASALNDFNIEKAKKAGRSHELCFSQEELEQIQEERAKQIEEAGEEAQTLEEGEAGTGAESDGSGSTASKNPGTSQGSSSSGGSAGGSSSSGGSGQTTTANMTCTIEIRCDTILNNMADLDPASLSAYVPSNGTILATTKVKFSQGETVFDVLNRICKAKGIQIEYSYTPMYGSYYIEGINHLYEFSCGPQSGWMYKVNGWFPNYGCSSYTLEEGDVIVWCYTCQGLGADVGGSVY